MRVKLPEKIRERKKFSKGESRANAKQTQV